MSKDILLQVSMKCCGFARFASITKVLVVLSLRRFLVRSLVRQILSETHSRVTRVFSEKFKEVKHLISPTRSSV